MTPSTPTSTSWTAEDARACIHLPTAQDHKYSRGVLGVVTGSRQYPGAAVLSCAAALATGVGMLRFVSTGGLADLVLQRCPEVVVAPGKVHAWLMGSGVAAPGGASLGNWLRHRQMARARTHTAPAVLDAGALYLAGTLCAPTLITPHAGELAALLGSRDVWASHQEVAAEPQKWAAIAHQELGVTVLLKGARTVVAGPGVCIALPEATPWLATAGTGDVLAGIVGALVVSQHEALARDPGLLAPLAATGAFIHARAADLASDGAPLTSASLLPAISQALRDILHAE